VTCTYILCKLLYVASSLRSDEVRTMRLSSDGDLNLDTGLNVDDDLLDDLGRSVKIDQTLVDSEQHVSTAVAQVLLNHQ